METAAANHRRNFIKSLATLGTMAMVSPGIAHASGQVKLPATNNTTVLFQGDSITDGNRTRNTDWNHVMGHGYAYLVASRLWYDNPRGGLHFFNRGISGNKITDLAGRWQKDTLELKPDVLSMLVGINDISALLNGNNHFGAEYYEKDYRDLLQQTINQLPGIQLVLCEPFILPVGKVKDRWNDYSVEIEKRRSSVKKLSLKFNAILVKFQDAFNKALTKAPAEYWIWDGIHPMPAGHELMAREWIRQVGKRVKQLR